MTFWQRVTIEDTTPVQTGTGNVRDVWSPLLEGIEARVLPLNVGEEQQTWATPEEDAYEVELRGAVAGLRPRMRVVIDAAAYDIRHIIQPPPFGTPVTILQCVRVTP